PFVADRDVAAEVLVVLVLAADEAAELDRRKKAVPDTDRVDLESALGARDGPPVPIDLRDHRPLHLVLALCPDDDVRVEEWQPLAGEIGHVSEPVGQEADVA